MPLRSSAARAAPRRRHLAARPTRTRCCGAGRSQRLPLRGVAVVERARRRVDDRVPASSISVGIGDDRVGVDAVGQHAAVAIDDVAALGRQRRSCCICCWSARAPCRRARRPGGTPAALRCRRSTAAKSRRRQRAAIGGCRASRPAGGSAGARTRGPRQREPESVCQPVRPPRSSCADSIG